MIQKSDLKSDTVKTSLVSMLISLGTLIASLLGIWGILPTDVDQRINESLPILMSISTVFSAMAIYFRKNIKTKLD